MLLIIDCAKGDRNDPMSVLDGMPRFVGFNTFVFAYVLLMGFDSIRGKVF